MLVIVFMCLVWFGCVLVCGWRVNEWFGGLEVGCFRWWICGCGRFGLGLVGAMC